MAALIVRICDDVDWPRPHGDRSLLHHQIPHASQLSVRASASLYGVMVLYTKRHRFCMGLNTGPQRRQTH
jgi:hypothetical protein